MLIAIEGIDGSGKGTQAGMLAERLRAQGNEVATLRFPQYESTLFGKEVGRYLNGEFGTLQQVDPKFSSLLYAMDRFQALQAITSGLERGGYVICDRFTGSNMAHQAARAPVAQQDNLMAWIREVEEDILGIPRPDLVLFLDMEVQHSQELVSRKEARAYTEKTHDLHEASLEHLTRASMNFRRLAVELGWVRVLCTDSQGRLRPTQRIGDEIYEWVCAKRASG